MLFWPKYSAKTPFAKFVPLLVMMMCRTPYLVMISLKNLMVDEPSSFFDWLGLDPLGELVHCY
jgi:hypothetical protein